MICGMVGSTHCNTVLQGKIIAIGTKDELVRSTIGEKREIVMVEKVPSLEAVFLHLTGKELRE